ncbi:MAG: CBS domain-containing protein [Planctomycetes bacterium]|nr:CBS domain-containing protein [Planctomycetota bacterium]
MKKVPPRASQSTPNAVHPGQMLVRDLMRQDVLMLRADDSIRSAAEQLEEARVSGAPVADATGRLVGVLTLRDIARSDHVSEAGVTTRAAALPAMDLEGTMDAAGEDEEVFSTEEYDDELLGRVRVAEWMTPGVIEVSPDATVAAACRRMLDESIHRLFVVEGERLLGVLSTEDVVRLLAEPPRASSRQVPARRAPARRRRSD